MLSIPVFVTKSAITALCGCPPGQSRCIRNMRKAARGDKRRQRTPYIDSRLEASVLGWSRTVKDYPPVEVPWRSWGGICRAPKSREMETRIRDEGGGLLPSYPRGIRPRDDVDMEFGKSAITSGLQRPMEAGSAISVAPLCRKITLLVLLSRTVGSTGYRGIAYYSAGGVPRVDRRHQRGDS